MVCAYPTEPNLGLKNYARVVHEIDDFRDRGPSALVSRISAPIIQKIFQGRKLVLSSTNMESILIFARCVVGSCNML